MEPEPENQFGIQTVVNVPLNRERRFGGGHIETCARGRVTGFHRSQLVKRSFENDCGIVAICAMVVAKYDLGRSSALRKTVDFG